MPRRIVLAYSGGLDTSVAIPWLRENEGADVVAAIVDVGQQEDVHAAAARALQLGASDAEVIDAKEEFAERYIHPAIRANALYEGVYPLSTALARPLIVTHVVTAAHAHGAATVAHGCTGKGNDQVRFELGLGALDPSLEVLAPARTWGMTRQDEIDYARARGLPIPVTKEKPYSIDENLWGRSIEGGVLEDPATEPPEDAYLWTTSPILAPGKAQVVDVEFEEGLPVAAAGSTDPVDMIHTLNVLAGHHGVGRIDHVESRVVGIKSREVYECPAAAVLLMAHKALEALTLPRDLLRFKASVYARFAEIVYDGQWFTPLRESLDAFIGASQARVTGVVTLKLFKGAAAVVGRESPYALYDHDLATYGAGDAFDAAASEGFVKIYGLSSKVWAQAGRKRVKAAPKGGVEAHAVAALAR